MQNYRREWIAGASYFFTVTTQFRRPLLTETPFYKALKSSIAEVMQQHPFSIDGFVLLPDHIHCIWTMPDDDADYSKRWSMIKRKVSQKTKSYLPPNRRKSQTNRKETGLWQRRFWEHRLRSDGDLERHMSYIHYNPVKHGYVSCVRDWPYSSFHKFVRQGVLPANWAGGLEPDTSVEFGEP